MSAYKLDNVIQHYQWGSVTSLSEMFGIANPTHEPQAEVWMGAHPNGCSKLASTGEPLLTLLEAHRSSALGQYTDQRFGELPFLFKVLAASNPLSIQVHPSKSKAEAGYEKENRLGIALDSPQRNYKDPNHKPELVYALTFYKAMNGFRSPEQIINLFMQADIPALSEALNEFIDTPNPKGLEQFFSDIMSLQGEKKNLALKQLYTAQKRATKTKLFREVMAYSTELSLAYPDDIGAFAPLLLNTIELAPDEAMFLHPETPHAYISGTGLEIMANSDNVLRAGLTSKFIDVDELIANTNFASIDAENLKLKPLKKDGRLTFPVPVDDFSFDIVYSSEQQRTQYLRSAEILFCLEGSITVSTADKTLILEKGESIFITNDSISYDFCGNGKLARAYN